MESKNNFKVIGLMSGTSLDGVDIAYCDFKLGAEGWSYRLMGAEMIPYSAAWRKKLSSAQSLSGESLISLSLSYGAFLGGLCANFVRRHRIKPDFIASHGHTIFHQPKKALTYQLGDGNAIHAASRVPVVFDFRSLDVLRGGEGAPLVPVGDALLFNTYEICLNLGGIANLSADVRGKRRAFDICFCNMLLNHLMQTAGKRYDKGGARSSMGKVNDTLLRSLTRANGAWREKRPSLGRELFERHLKGLLDRPGIPLEDKLSTVTESIAIEIVSAFRSTNHIKGSVLCTGGGAFNHYLMSRILEHCGDDFSLVVPEDDIVKFKEAVVFAFLGVLRVRGEVNCFRSVTGAASDSVAGSLIAG